MPLPPGSRLGNYEILAPLGAGGMGEVYRAKDTRLGREVALKILPATRLGDEASRSQLLHEAQTASSLNHPHICTIYETGEADERLFIAMELVPGQNLSTLIGHEGLPADTAIRYGVQLADALSHAHLQGVVHRDLKPGNVMITPEGRTKILDFGLASRATTDLNDVTRSEAPLTQHAGLGGTLPYMAPEQLRGEAATVASDLWSLGVMLYEMTCGRRPFQGRTGFEITSAVLRDTPPPLAAGLPAGLRAVIQRCLTKEAGQRYRQAGEVRAALESIALESSGAVLPAVGSTRRFGVRALWAVGAIIVLAAFLVSKFGRPTGPGATRPVSLAVLPLQNLSGDSTQEYFSDGMTEALISDLAQIRALKVISRTSVMHYKKTDKLLSQIAGELGVTYIVEGSVLRAANRVRITAQLIEAATDQHLWAHSYDRDLGDVLALHSEVAGAIAKEVRVKLTPGEGNRLGARPAVKPAAYEAYLKGRYFAGRGNLPSAIERFRESTQLDSSYAPAFSGLASALVFSANLGNSPSAELMPEARGSAHTALSLDPGLAEAHTARAIVCMFYEYDWPCADREFRLAVNLNPGDPEVHHWYAHYLVAIGKTEAGLAEIRRARESDPLAPVLNADVATTLALLGRYAEAEQENRKALELDPGSRRGTAFGDWILARRSQFAEAAAGLERDAPAERTPRSISTLGHYYGRAGNKEKALRCVQDLRALSAKRYVSPYEFARVYVGLGDKDKAFEYLDKAYDARNFALMYFKVDPEYDPIRSDPRFHALLRKIGLE